MSVNTKKVPKLRFPGFSDDWKEKKLGDIADFSKGAGISKADIVRDGNIKAIRYGELYTTYKEVIVNVVSSTNIDTRGLVFSKTNDVIIPASGETHIDIATASCVLESNVALSGDLNIIRTDNNGVFLAYYLNNAKKYDIAKLGQGVSVVHLYPASLKQLKINLPEKIEQQKIAGYLGAVDEKIDLLSKKKERLEKYKKGLMKKIFNQEIRFKDENGQDYLDWQEKKLSEISYSETSPLSANQIEGRSGEYKVYGASGILQTLDTYHYEHEYIAIVKDGAGVGRIGLYEPKSSVLGIMIVIQPKSETNKLFLYYLLQMLDFKKYITGSTIPHVYYKQYSKEKFTIPNNDEQKKIADFLSDIDRKIEAEERKLEKAKEFKKALLQQMFV